MGQSTHEIRVRNGHRSFRNATLAVLQRNICKIILMKNHFLLVACYPKRNAYSLSVAGPSAVIRLEAASGKSL